MKIKSLKKLHKETKTSTDMLEKTLRDLTEASAQRKAEIERINQLLDELQMKTLRIQLHQAELAKIILDQAATN